MKPCIWIRLMFMEGLLQRTAADASSKAQTMSPISGASIGLVLGRSRNMRDPVICDGDRGTRMEGQDLGLSRQGAG